MKRRAIILVLTGLLAAAGAGVTLAVIQGGGGGESLAPVYEVENTTFVPPLGATDDDIADYVAAKIGGDPLPPGYTNVETMGLLSVFRTSMTRQAIGGGTETLHTLTLVDDSADLDEARLYRNGNLLATLTRSNGGITDDAQGMATAATSVWVPDNIQGESYYLEWDDVADSVSTLWVDF